MENGRNTPIGNNDTTQNTSTTEGSQNQDYLKLNTSWCEKTCHD